MTLLRNRRRRGFTLIELLMVIAIIIFLMSLAGAVAMVSLSGARTAATKAMMSKIQRQLQSRIEAVNRAFSSKSSQTQLYNEIANIQPLVVLMQQNPNYVGRVRTVTDVLTRKIYMRTYLPQTWAEAGFLLRKSGKTAPTTINARTESAEVLYFFLSDASIVGFTPANQDLFSGNEVRDTDGNGALELVDAWGSPVRFYRWPTRLLRPTGYTGLTAITSTDFERAQLLIYGVPTSLKVTPSLSVPSSLAHDPDDGMNVLTPGNGFLTSAADATNFENGTSKPLPFHTVFTWHTPLVVSAGPDKEFGIYDSTVSGHLGRLCEPYTSGTEQTYLYDNVTTHNVKSGAN